MSSDAAPAPEPGPVPSHEPSPEHAETRWLNDVEMQTWLNLAAVMMWLPAALDAQLRREAGLSHFEYQVLAMLSQSAQRSARMSDIAARANGTPSRLSHVVARLEERGWITRTPGEGRAVLASLTDAGWDKLVATAPGHVRTVRSYVFDQLSDKQVRELGIATKHISKALNLPEN